ncbi:MAG: glycosyltransferase family protein [Micrococcaceae bacterium]
MSTPLKRLRKGLWHWRQGGYSQYREWRRRSKYHFPDYSIPASTVGSSPQRIDEYYPAVTPLQRPKSFPGLRVGVILDEFSLAAWGPEFEMVVLTPQRWREELVREPIDLLFVESAWAGNGGAWQYHLTGSHAPRPAVLELVNYCKAMAVPTVFWNKEDPPHFEDFLPTAKLFDVVFTSDSNLIPKYRELLGHDRVDSLSFAAQPSIHNPVRIRGLHNQNDMAFAGMYFSHKYKERREQMHMLLGAAVRVFERGVYSFDIFSRHHGGDEKYQFPLPFKKHVVGALPYEKMLAAYRAYKVFLNVNSVTDSPSMCARRVFEIIASGTPVVSTESAAIPKFFRDNEVPVVRDEATAAYTLRAMLNSSQLRDRTVHRAQRRIWEEHTYAHRTAKILQATGLRSDSPFLEQPSVSAIVSTNRPQFLFQAIDSVSAQKQKDNLELVLLTHGFDAQKKELESYARDHGIENFTLLHAHKNDSLGVCLNRLVKTADGDVIAKFDDDDFYAAHYLSDSINALKYSGADLVGKLAVYMYSQTDDAIVLRNPGQENMFTNFIAGATFVGKGDLFRKVQFSPVRRGEDTRFLKSAEERGARIYAADRFNFMQMRGSHSHTWDVEDVELYANGVIESYGMNARHVVVDDDLHDS